MSVRAEAIPLEGPLAGGSEGASVVVEPIEAGRARFTQAFYEYEGGRLGGLKALGFRAGEEDYLDVPVPAYLVRHPTAGPMLIDTGLHPSVARDPDAQPGPARVRVLHLEPGGDVTSQLREKGLGPGDIEVVVLTHLHFDHASAISEFPESTFVVSEPEWETRHEPAAAAAGGLPPRPLRPRVRLPHGRFRARTTSTPTAPLVAPSTCSATGACASPTPRDTRAGHMSVLLGLPRRDFVVLADVAYTWRQLEGGPEPWRPADRHNWRRSLHEAQAYRRAYPYALVVPGHDPEFWRKLDSRYEE